MKNLSKQEIDDLMLTVGDGVLALADNKMPYCIPFGFVYVQDTVYISMIPAGRKWSYIQKNPRVCFTVFQWNKDHTEWSSVVIDGVLEPVHELETIGLVVKANIEKVGLDADSYLEKRMEYYKKNIDNPRALKIFKIKASNVKGRKMRTLIGS